MNTDLIDWNLEHAAEELTWANRVQARLSADPQQFAHEIAECRYEVGMHIASANALIETRTQIGPDDAIVKAEGGAA